MSSSPLKHVVRIQWRGVRQWPSKMLFASFLNPLLFFGTHFLLFMSRNSLQMALFPGQAIYGARIIPTENSFGTPSLQQKRCYRTCAHPPTVCFLRLLFTVSNLSICRLVAALPSSLISVVLVLGLFVHPSNKRTVVLVRAPAVGAVWRSQPIDWSFYIWCFPCRTMQCCVLLSPVSIFLTVMLAVSAST